MYVALAPWADWVFPILLVLSVAFWVFLCVLCRRWWKERNTFEGKLWVVKYFVLKHFTITFLWVFIIAGFVVGLIYTVVGFIILFILDAWFRTRMKRGSLVKDDNNQP